MYLFFPFRAAVSGVSRTKALFQISICGTRVSREALNGKNDLYWKWCEGYENGKNRNAADHKAPE